jgi:Flp pilus assembly secretin CpaC
VIDIHVDTVDARVVQELRRILDNPSIELDVVGSSVVMRGDVPNLQHFERAEMVASAFVDQITASTGGGGKKTASLTSGGGGDQNGGLLNLLEVGGNHQVMIEIVIAELSRQVRHAMGVNLFGAIAIDDQKYATFQTLLKNMTSNPEMAIAPGTPAGMTAMTESVTMAGSFFSSDSFDLRMFLEMVEANQLGSILAEPTLVARSGELADFLVGGETPIPIVRDIGVTGSQYSIVFKKFGVNVEFTPTVMSEDRIHMAITSEVSEPDFTYGVRILGSAVPAFRTRRVNTTVELGDGQTFVMAGLLREDIVGDVESVPLLGDIPILGNLFRSRAWQKKQTEMVMIVTPRLVKPTGHERIELPTDHYIEPTKGEFYWDGLIQGRPEKPEDSDVEAVSDESSSDAALERNEVDSRAAAHSEDAGSSAAFAHEPAKSTPGGLIGAFGHRLPVPAPTGGEM